MIKGFINRILPFSSVDGPGNRTAIFLQGCNFNCLYCHNPETINHCIHCGKCAEECPYDALTLENNKVIWNKILCENCDKCLEVCPNNSSPKVFSMSVDEVLKEINKTKAFVSGITLSGGECTLQSEFLTSLFTEVRKMGLTCFIDTNGSIPLYNRKELLEVMDMAMIDLKSYNSVEHEKLTGMDNKVVIENIEYLGRINKLYEVRTVIVPETLNNHYNVDMISKLISSINPNIRYKIIKYRAMGVRPNMLESDSPSDDMMQSLKELAMKNGCENVVLV